MTIIVLKNALRGSARNILTEKMSHHFGNIYIHVSDGKTYAQMVSEGDKMPSLWDLNPRRPQS